MAQRLARRSRSPDETLPDLHEVDAIDIPPQSTLNTITTEAPDTEITTEAPDTEMIQVEEDSCSESITASSVTALTMDNWSDHIMLVFKRMFRHQAPSGFRRLEWKCVSL
jgi:hypothetical protein